MSIDHTSSNAAKAVAGAKNLQDLKKICERLKGLGLINKIETKVELAHKSQGMTSDFEQYYAKLLITDTNDDIILIYTTTSFRSDRFKITCWDAQGVSQYSEISDRIVAVFFVINDEEYTSSDYRRYRDAAIKGDFFSPITHWLSFSDFEKYMTNWENNQNSHNFDDFLIEAESGSIAAKRGNAFEKYLTQRFNQGLITRIDGKNPLGDKIYQRVYNYCLGIHGLNRKDIVSMTAGRDFHLDSGGLGKTDLLVTLTTKNNVEYNTTFSQKISNCNSVSCHEYSAAMFEKVLCEDDGENEFLELREGLKLFQKVGSWKFLADRSQTWIDIFFKQLKSKTPRLCEWAIKGISRQNEDLTFHVDALILVQASTQQFRVVSTDEYIAELLNVDNTRYEKKKGYPFSWTRASGSAGSRIQLKMPLIF